MFLTKLRNFIERLPRLYSCSYRYFLSVITGMIFLGIMENQGNASTQVGLYGIFETQVANVKKYKNPFDFRLIELQSKFVAPSGKQYTYFGFYDGDGRGGLSGDKWKMRFMPNEIGIWSYSYKWTDGTPGGQGSFHVIDTGLPGPLRVAADNPWYFEDARGRPFHWRGYSLHLYIHWKYGEENRTEKAYEDLFDKIINNVAKRAYNVLMLDWPVNTNGHKGLHFWQQADGTIDFSRYNISQWKKVEQTLEIAAARKVYIFQFLALVHQNTMRPSVDQMIPYLRYMAARLGPYWNNFGYSAVWEYHDIWTHEYANSVMKRMKDNLSGLPVPPLLSIHDHSNNQFIGWLDFSMRQLPSKTIYDGNIHGGGKQGGVGTAFLNRPIIGSEDIWEACEHDLPCNGDQVRRAGWGLLMAGVMPVYLEYTGENGEFKGKGESYIRHMYNFFYSKTNYRKYIKLNKVISGFRAKYGFLEEREQIASGVPGYEYLIYSEGNKNIIINLSEISSSTVFSVLWFDPKTGKELIGGNIEAGSFVNLTSPIIGDTVLLLKRNN